MGFVQDATAGIAIRLDAALVDPLPAGTVVTVDGTLGSYFSLRTLNVVAGAIELGDSMTLPAPIGSGTGAATEALEAIRLSVEGAVTGAPSVLADGLGVTIDDGSGDLRLVIGSEALAGRTIETGDKLRAIGPLGQRDSSGTGLAGYRLHVSLPGELELTAPPTPSPTPTATPTPTPTATPTPTPAPISTPTPIPPPTPTLTPTPSPSSTPTPTGTSTVAIALARSTAIGSTVTVQGIVTAEAGRLGTPALIAIQDATAAIVVRLPDGFAKPVRGSRMVATGTLADPYGQLEIRSISAIRNDGPATIPAARAIDAIGDTLEASLVTIEGTATGRPTKATSGDIAFTLETAAGDVRIVADASAGVPATSVVAGDRLRVTGIVGQRATRKGADDGFRIWLRGPSDIARVGGPVPSATTSPGPTSSPAPSGGTAPGRTITIVAAILARSGIVTIEGSITTPARLLDATARRIVVQDGTAAVEVLLPTGLTAPPVGARIRVTGETGRAYDAPRIRASAIVRIGSATVAPLELRAAPGAAHEWRLVRIRGDLVEVHRSGDRWTAELLVAGVRVPIAGLAGAAIPVAGIVNGHSATFVGIVRRPHPSATDRRFIVTPRSAADVMIGASADDTSPGAGPSGGRGGTASPGGTGAPGGPGAGSTPGAQPLAVDLATLDAHVGSSVRVSGLVAAVSPDGFRLDDGTAVAEVRLRGAAADLGSSIAIGDGLSAVGRVELDPVLGSAVVVVEDPAAIALVGGFAGPDNDSTATPGASVAAHAGSPAPPESDRPSAALVAGLGEPMLPEFGIIGLVLVSVVSLFVTFLRRQRTRRRFAARIAARLEAVVGSATGGAALLHPAVAISATRLEPMGGSQPGRNGPAPADDPTVVAR